FDHAQNLAQAKGFDEVVKLQSDYLREQIAAMQGQLKAMGDQVASAARPKIAAYPFTTLAPNLGVVPLSDHRSFVVADIPGIIEGAHTGKGLGLQFLRHIERTRILAFLIPIDSDDWQREYDQLRGEVASYSAELAQRPHCVVFTKLDLLGEPWVPEIEAPTAFARFSISAAGREGLDPLLDAWWRELLRLRQAEWKATDPVALP
nr:50S ribosome-binding GTPase [Gemmatimonadaceae bacterium]